MMPRYARLIVLVLTALALGLLSISPASYATAHATVGLYSDSSCTTLITSANLGATVYAKYISATGSPTGPFTLQIKDVSAIVVHSVTGISGAPYCDSTGYSIPTSESTGTWSIALLDSTSADICFSGCTFQVNAAIPDLPLGAILLVVPVLMVYLAMRSKANLGQA